MLVFQLLFTLVAIVMIGATAVSMLRQDYWQVRIFDFPRLQISFALIVLIAASPFVFDFRQVWSYILVGLMLLSLVYQMARIYHYTFFAKKQVERFYGDDPENSISLIISNVLQSNRKAEKLLRQVRELQPDVLLTLESDHWWEEQLMQLKDDYPYRVNKPQDNRYGMHLYSRLELESAEIKFNIKNDIPSIEGFLKLRSGNPVHFFCLHPSPPSPTESPSSTNRDGELLTVGKKLKSKEVALIFGDLNDVAWSRTTTLFQQISGLLDPRRGRGFFNTYHAKYALMRWPLDHIFHSDDFKLIEIHRLDKIGSDHFPIYARLQYTKRASEDQDEMEPEKEDRKLAKEKITSAQNNKE